MHANIEIKEVMETYKKGWFSKGTETMWRVYPNVTLTKADVAKIDHLNLWDRVCYTHHPNLSPAEKEAAGSGGAPISIGHFCKKDFYIGTRDPIEAKDVAHTFEHKIIPTIQQYL